MAEEREKLVFAKGCQIGIVGGNKVALKIKFATSPDKLKDGPFESATFGLTADLTQGLAKGLEKVLADLAKANQPAKKSD